MTTRRMESFDRREQILGCAIKLFEQQPYDTVSLTAVAKAAGVARPLVNHYFGNKQALYLAAVRRLTELPPMAFDGLPLETTEATSAAVVDHWLSVVKRNRRMWLAVIGLTGSGARPEVREAVDRGLASVADRLVSALGLRFDPPDRDRVRAALMSYVEFAKEVSRQWLSRGLLDEDDVRRLTTAALAAMVATVQDWEGVHVSPAD